MERIVLETSSYQAFRANVLEFANRDRKSAASWSDHEDGGPAGYWWSREQVRQGREWVCKNLPTLLAQVPESERHIRRLLGVPEVIPLIAERWPLWRCGVQFLMPMYFAWRYVRGALLEVKTYEARAYLFKCSFKRVLACRLEFYSPAIDWALRHFETPSWQEASELSRQDPGWVKATCRLGLRKMAQVIPYAQYGHGRVDGAFADLLVQMKVITTVDELQWLDYCEPYDYNRSERHSPFWRKVRKIVMLMVHHGIARRSIAELFRYSLSSFNVERLEANLVCIQTSGVQETTALFTALGDLLWRTRPANLDFLLNVVGAKSCHDIQRFTNLLEASALPSREMAEALIALGAGIDGLVQCQKLLLEAESKNVAVSIAALRVLASPPHALTIENLALCSDYLAYPEELSKYLAVLDKYGFGYAAAVVAFQTCYRKMYIPTLDSWLGIIGTRSAGVQLESLVEWVRRNSSEGNADSYQYLIQSIPMPDFKHLQQAEPLVRFRRSFLEFLVFHKGLVTIQQLRDWYFQARGVQELNCCSALDAINLLVLDDAYTRNNFAFVTSNQAAIYEAVRERVDSLLGPRLRLGDDTARDQYHKSHEALRSAERAALVPILPTILTQTGGLLLQSVLRCAWLPPEVMLAQLNALTPLIDGLLAGQGPTGQVLSELETDAIGMLYRTSPDTVARTWPKVLGYEHHLASLVLSSHYPMEWTRSIRELRVPLERSSLLALARAKLLSRKFSRYASESTFDACKYLRARRLGEKARDPWSLTAHLGVLFAAADGDSIFNHWITHELDGMSQIVEEGADVALRLEQLDQIFSTTLPDALKGHAETFTRRFSEADAAFLAGRLVGEKADFQGATGWERLLEALHKTQVSVLETCVRWVHRERRKFVKIKQGQNATKLNAILSKHPAVYFAKHAANLCTRENVSMWYEKRCAHLVVLDPAQRRLAGMALVYIEPIVALDSSRDALIIRAINPMDDMLATHSISSIVDAVIDVVIAIAKSNDLAAVAIPWHNGCHLLSNQSRIEKDLEKRFINRAVSYWAPRSSSAHDKDPSEWRVRPREVSAKFYAYAHGDEEVKKLFAIWSNGVGERIAEEEYTCLEEL